MSHSCQDMGMFAIRFLKAPQGSGEAFQGDFGFFFARSHPADTHRLNMKARFPASGGCSEDFGGRLASMLWDVQVQCSFYSGSLWQAKRERNR